MEKEKKFEILLVDDNTADIELTKEVQGESGLDLPEKIKTDETIKHIPVFMPDVLEEKKDINRAYKLHTNCYITKSAGSEEFLKIVRRIKEFRFETVKLPGDNA